MTCELLFLAAWLGILLTDHVIPGQCRHEFCWECLTSYAEIRQNGRESHKDGCYFRTSVTGPTGLRGSNLQEALGEGGA